MLEKNGFNGQLLLIDGAPHFLAKHIRLHLGEHSTDNDIYNLLLSAFVQMIFPEDVKEVVGKEFDHLSTIEQKMKKFGEHIEKQSLYSCDYLIAMIHALFRRICSVISYDLKTFKSINTPITLVRPTEVALQDIDEDYSLKEITKGAVIVEKIEGNHTTMLDNPHLSNLINDCNPSLKDFKDFEKTTKQ